MPIKKGFNKIIYQDKYIVKFLIESVKHGNYEIIIDNEDLNKINKFRWGLKYNNGDIRAIQETRKSIKLHNLIMNDKWIDHVSGDIFDNRKINLRKCDKFQNAKNRKINKNNICGFKGVHYRPKEKKYVVSIQFNKNYIYLGYFKNKHCAACAYNNAAIKYHGEFAKLNCTD
jgi:hypothetical protein